MKVAARRSARPFAPLVHDDASSLEAMAGAVMRLHNTLLTIGRCYTTDAAGDRAMLELGRIESVLAGAFCTIFGQSPADRFTDIFDQVAYVAEHMVKDHIFEDGNKRIGTHAMLVFLDINQISLNYEDKDLIETILAVASGTLDYNGLLSWLQCHIES